MGAGSQAWVRGPAHIFAGVGASYSPVYLGTAERSPRIQIRRHFQPVWNSITGLSVPYDYCYDGQDGFVVADLTRWVYTTLLALQGQPRQSLSAATPGLEVAGDIGTMMKTEGFSIPLWLLFPYAAKAAYAGQPAGMRFPATWLQGPDDLDENNTNAAKVRCVWYCGPLTVINVPSAGVNGLLYDFNMAGLPAIS